MKTLILLLLIPIMISGQTVLEKFKARQDSVMKANRERIDSPDTAKSIYPIYNPESERLLKEFEEMAKNIQFFPMPTTVIRTTWLDEFIDLWDEYAKWVEEQPVTEDKWIVKKNGDIVNEGGWTKPSLDGFIEFLRNKLKGN